MHLRIFQLADFDAVVALWESAGLHLNQSDSRAGIQHKIARDGDLFLVAIDDGTIVGALMGSYDGRRGWMNHLAVAASHRHQGIGHQLMQEVESRLLAKGCDKVNLLVTPANAAVQGFYEQQAYRRREIIMLEKWLVDVAGENAHETPHYHRV